MLNESILILTHSEEVVLLGDSNDITTLWCLSIYEIFFRKKAFFADGVPALIVLDVDFALVPKILQALLNGSLVKLICGSEKNIVLDIELFPDGPKVFLHFVTVCLWGETSFFRGLLHFLAVFVDTCEEQRFVPEKTMITGDHIGHHGGVSMSDVGRVVDVVNRGREIEAHGPILANRRHLLQRFRYLGP